MDHISVIQNVLDTIDENITQKISVKELAAASNYSFYHFCRIFQELTGMPVMSYITRRKLEYALSDIACGKKIIDVAMDYGYDTHAGFTKAFKRCFGYPPSIYCIHVGANPPQKNNLSRQLKKYNGGIIMNPQIVTKKPFTIVGFTSRHTLPEVRYTHDIPAYWDNVNMDYAQQLTVLHDTFSGSKHCEYGVCYDTDIKTSEFTYLLGVGVDNDQDLSKITNDMKLMKMPGGLYAIFTTPLVDDSEYTTSIHETWKEILVNWLPNSKYEFDEKRYDFEFYDERDHAWENNNKVQMDIYIPICQRKK